MLNVNFDIFSKKQTKKFKKLINDIIKDYISNFY